MAGPKADDRVVAGAPEAPRRPGFVLRGLGWSTTAMSLAAIAGFGLGFLYFISHVPDEEVAPLPRADGIVVLTGGSSRISDAIELLARGHGRRLLISGANRTTTADAISRLNPEFDRWVRCCVDFDHSLNTLGNAIETREWAHRRGFRSLIVVTSNYHMPRAMAEIANQLPDATLLGYPVVSDRIKAEPWWGGNNTTRLLLSEYLKYIVARMRIRFNPGHGASA